MDESENIPQETTNLSNKDILFKKILGIDIKNFRSFRNRKIELGNHFTLITGKNGTMKSSLLGLIGHPFSSPNMAKDLYGRDLKTRHSDVFKLSLEKDIEEYRYFIEAETLDGDHIKEPVRIYPRPNENRHRVTVGKDNKAGSGNFALNTSYINLKRLFPIIETTAEISDITLSEDEKKWISNAYYNIIQRNSFSNFETISDKKTKHTFAPKNSFYDFNSISSGEDNIGFILGKMIAFKRNILSNNALQGIFCIDEFDASLHPVAQVRLFDFIYNWAKRNNIQVIATTHSLFLVKHFIDKQKNESNKSFLSLVNISTSLVGNDNNYKVMLNPDYNTIYKELTYQTLTSDDYKINILCEDDVAKKIITSILSKKSLTSTINFISNISGRTGTSCNSLLALVRNGKNLLSDSIVIVDPDVNISRTNINGFNDLLKIPDSNELPVEKRVLYFIYNLDGEDNLFHNMEKLAILSTFTDYNIDFSNISIIKSQNTERFKNWANDNKILFNKALVKYVKSNETLFLEFRNTLIEKINEHRSCKGLPTII